MPNEHPSIDSGQAGHGAASRHVQLEDAFLAARAALDVATDAILQVDVRTWRVRMANATSHVLLGLGQSELPGLCFQRLCERLHADDGSAVTPQFLARPAFRSGEFTFERSDASRLAVEVRTSVVRLARHKLLLVVIRDLSERVSAACELRAASARCGITFSQAATGLSHVLLDGRWSKVNRRLEDITGYSEAELLELTVADLTHPEDLGNDALAYRRLLDGDMPFYTREKRYLRKDGSEVWVSVTNSLATGKHGEPLYFIGMVEDISERKRSEAPVRHLASHDVLTGLPNRLGLQDYLDRALEAAEGAGRELAVVFVDMDKLKQINDLHGHETGDHALMALASQLQQHVRAGDMVARIGGDEFVIVLAGLHARAEVNAILDRLLRALAAAGGTGATAPASCSIGISVFPHDGADGRTLIRNADLAMYRAKQRGGAAYEYFGAPGKADLRLIAHAPVARGAP